MLRGMQQRGGQILLWLLIGLLIGGVVGAVTAFLLNREKGGIPGSPRLGQAEELAMVPVDAFGFVHVRARDLWKSEFLTELRNLVENAGPEQLSLIDEGFAPAPSTLDRATLVLFQNSTQPANTLPPPPKFKEGQLPTPPVVPGKLPPQPKVPGKVAPGKLAPAPFMPQPNTSKSLFDFPDKFEYAAILTFTAPFNESRVREALLPAAERKEVGGREYWETPKGLPNQVAAYFPNDKILVIGTPAGVHQLLGRQTGEGKQTEGPLTGALHLAATGSRQIVAAVNARQFRVNLTRLNDEIRDLPMNGEDLVKLVDDTKPLQHTEAYAVSLSLMGMDDSKIDIRAYFRDEKEAEDGDKAVRALADFAHKKLAEPRKMLEEALNVPADKSKPRALSDLPKAILSLVGVGALNKVDEYLVDPPLKLHGKELVATIEIPSIVATYSSNLIASAGLLIPALSSVQKMHQFTDRVLSTNNLKQITLAMHSYNAANGHLPASSPLDRMDRVQLSWRVELLPYLEQGALYQQFKHDEPWDSPHNKQLIDRMPAIYQSPLAAAPPGKTYYKVFSGGGALFGPGKKVSMNAIPDGIANTVMAVEGGEPVIWTKPDDIPFDPNKPLPDLSLQGKRQILVVMADGSVRAIDLDRISEKTFKAAITMAGGEKLGTDW